MKGSMLFMILIAVFNAVMMYSNYQNEWYGWAMVSSFVTGALIASLAWIIVILNEPGKNKQ